MIHKLFCTLGLCLLTLSPLRAQEIKYVTDVLLLSLHEKAGSQGELLKKLPSGTRLDVLEEAGLFARVRTEDGIEGWTKSGFLTNEMPARTRVLELEQQQEKLTRELEQQREKLKQLQTQKQDELQQLQARLSELQAAQQSQDEESASKAQNSEETANLIAQLRQENQAFRQSMDDTEIQIPQRWAMIAASVLLLLGFIAGIAWFDYRSRRRHGGYRIY